MQAHGDLVAGGAIAPSVFVTRSSLPLSLPLLSLSLHPPLPFPCPPRSPPFPPAPLSLSLKAVAAGGGKRRSWTCDAVTPLAMCSGRLGFPGEGSPARQSSFQTIAGVACKRLQLQPRSSRLAHRAYLAARAAAKRRSKRQAANCAAKAQHSLSKLAHLFHLLPMPPHRDSVSLKCRKRAATMPNSKMR